MELGEALATFALLATLALGVYAVVQLRRRRRPILTGLGLGVSTRTPADLLAGLVVAGLAMALVAAAEFALGAVAFRPGAPAAALLPRLGSDLALAALEEVLSRALALTALLYLLRDRRLAVLVSAALFGLLHAANPGADAVSVLGNAVGGLIYALAFVGSGAVWLPLGLHFGWNAVQGAVLGLPVSGGRHAGLLSAQDLGPAWLTGGDYGPEPGLLGFSARLLVLGGLVLWLRRRGPRAA